MFLQWDIFAHINIVCLLVILIVLLQAIRLVSPWLLPSALVRGIESWIVGQGLAASIVGRSQTLWSRFLAILWTFVAVRIIFVISWFTINRSMNEEKVYSQMTSKDPPRKGHCMLVLSIWDTVWGPNLRELRGQPLYKGQNSWIYIVPIVSFVWRFDCNYVEGNMDLSVLYKPMKYAISHPLYGHILSLSFRCALTAMVYEVYRCV